MPRKPTTGTARAGGEAPPARLLLRRNPDAPLYYAPVFDVRATRNDLHLLLFTNPAPDPDEVVEDAAGRAVTVESQAEVVVPLPTVEALLRALAHQYRQVVLSRLHEDAAAAGMEVGDLRLPGVDDLLAAGDKEG
jgi:hypothetical protein